MYISSSKASILILYLTAGGLTGLGFSLMMLPSFDILTYYFTKNLGLATGLGTMGSPVGQMILGPLLNYTITTLGPGTSLCCLSGLMLLGVGSGLCFTIPCKKKLRHRKDRNPPPIKQRTQSRHCSVPQKSTFSVFVNSSLPLDCSPPTRISPVVLFTSGSMKI